MFSKHNIKLTSRLGVFGLALGIGSLVVSMAAVSGYETTLKNSLIDMVGHVLVTKRGASESDLDKVWTDLSLIKPEVVASTPFLWLEGFIVHKSKLNSVFMEGVDPDTVSKVLNFKGRILEGSLDLGENEHGIKVLVGKAIAKRYDLKIGDTFKVVIPSGDDVYNVGMRPKVIKMVLSGVLELGRYDYNQRFIMMDLVSAQQIISQPGRIAGMRLKIKDEMIADKLSFDVNANVGHPYHARSWRSYERNMFEAVVLEKRVIFFVLLVMVVAACFNVSSTIFVSVLNKVKDISVLKSIGLKNRDILQVFCFQGVFIGLVGNLFGFLVGGIFCFGFYWLQVTFNILPAESYGLDRIQLDIRAMDLLWVFLASMSVCIVASLFPALKGARLKILEGIHYE